MAGESVSDDSALSCKERNHHDHRVQRVGLGKDVLTLEYKLYSKVKLALPCLVLSSTIVVYIWYNINSIWVHFSTTFSLHKFIYITLVMS